MSKDNVLVLCVGNTARSQMAEAFLKKYAGDKFNVYSAGLEPKEQLHPYTVKVMEELGYDMSGHHPKPLKDFMGRMHYKYIMVVCQYTDDSCPRALWQTSGTRLDWGFDDPAAAHDSEEQQLQKFREVRDQIHRRIREWYPKA